LLKIATRINRLRRTHELVREILDSIFEIVPVDRGAILLTQGEKEFTPSTANTGWAKVLPFR
jgi:hypothetical protein